ncbi:MAG: hypothetical protein ABSF83_13370 [Nitrososphaerales archaeon]
MAKMIQLPLIRRNIRLAYLVVLSCILVGSVGAYAASVTINATTNAGYQGEYVVDNGYFSASAMAYNVVQSAQAATTAPLAWSNGATAYVNTLAAGDWEAAWTLTLNAGATASHTYTITVTSTAADGTTSVLYTFQFTTAGTITPGQTMTILWDTGATTWTAPAAVQITVV